MRPSTCALYDWVMAASESISKATPRAPEGGTGSSAVCVRCSLYKVTEVKCTCGPCCCPLWNETPLQMFNDPQFTAVPAMLH